MKIAIPVLTNEGKKSVISEHFGHAPHFAYIEMSENGKYEINIEKNSLEGHGPGDIPRFLANKKVNKVIVRGVGGRAIGFFQQLGIDVIKGAEGNIEEIMESLENKSLKSKEYTPKEKHKDH